MGMVLSNRCFTRFLLTVSGLILSPFALSEVNIPAQMLNLGMAYDDNQGLASRKQLDEYYPTVCNGLPATEKCFTPIVHYDETFGNHYSVLKAVCSSSIEGESGSGQYIFLGMTGSHPDVICTYDEPPCKEANLGYLTWQPPYATPACINNCRVAQTSDTQCTGAAVDGGSCTASFKQLEGLECTPDSDEPETEPAEPGSHTDLPGGDSGGGDSGGGDSGGGDSGGGDSGGGDSGGGDSGGGDSGGGDSGGGDSGGGDSGGGDSSGDSSGYGDGHSVLSGTCTEDSIVPPQCTGDPITCSINEQIFISNCNDELSRDGIYGDDEYSGGDSLLDESEDNEIPEEEIDVASQLEVDTSGFGGGSCPQPLTADVYGNSIEFSYEPVCTYASKIRPLILAIAYFIGYMAFVRIVGSE